MNKEENVGIFGQHVVLKQLQQGRPWRMSSYVGSLNLDPNQVGKSNTVLSKTAGSRDNAYHHPLSGMNIGVK